MRRSADAYVPAGQVVFGVPGSDSDSREGLPSFPVYVKLSCDNPCQADDVRRVRGVSSRPQRSSWSRRLYTARQGWCRVIRPEPDRGQVIPSTPPPVGIWSAPRPRHPPRGTGGGVRHSRRRRAVLPTRGLEELHLLDL